MSSAISSIQTPAPLGGGRAWLVWLLANAFVIYLFNVQTGYAIVNPDLARDLKLDLSQIGTVAAVYTWAFAIAQLFGGALLDRLGAGKVLPLAAALVTAGVYVFATAQDYPSLLLSQFIVALGSCVGFVGAGYVGGQWFGMAKFGLMFGLVQTLASLSSAFGQAGIEYALHQMSWRELALGAVQAGVVLVALMALLVRNPQPVARGQGGIGHFFSEVLGAILHVGRNSQVWVAGLIGAMTFGAMLAMGVIWAPKILIAQGFSKETANYAAPLLWVGLAVGSIFINRLTDLLRSRKQPLLYASLLQLACQIYLIWAGPSALGAYLALFLYGLANAGHMLAFTVAADNVPGEEIGTASALVNGTMFVVGGVLMSLPGSLLAAGDGSLHSFRLGMSVLIGALGLAVVLDFWLRESYPRQR